MDQTKSSRWHHGGAGGRPDIGLDPAEEELGRRPANAYRGMQSGLAGLAKDALKLVDLQVQLLGLDVQDFWSRAQLGVVLLVVALIGLISCLPVLMAGVAYFVAAGTVLSVAAAFCVTAVVSGVLAIGLLWWSLKRLTTAAGALERSQTEFQQNLAWFRATLHRGDED